MKHSWIGTWDNWGLIQFIFQKYVWALGDKAVVDSLIIILINNNSIIIQLPFTEPFYFNYYFQSVS